MRLSFLELPTGERRLYIEQAAIQRKMIFTRTVENRLCAGSDETMKINRGLIFTRTGENRLCAGSDETMKINREMIFT
jgi:hypothetical protein